MPDIIDWQQPRRRPRRLLLLVIAILAVIIFSSRTALSYYVDSLWFSSLGYEDVFRKTLILQWAVFAAFFALTFLFLYGWFLALMRLTKPIFRTITELWSAARRCIYPFRASCTSWDSRHLWSSVSSPRPASWQRGRLSPFIGMARGLRVAP